jgi:hypothetical protein
VYGRSAWSSLGCFGYVFRCFLFNNLEGRVAPQNCFVSIKLVSGKVNCVVVLAPIVYAACPRKRCAASQFTGQSRRAGTGDHHAA